MKYSILYLAAILLLLVVNSIAVGQHYYDWTGFEWTTIEEELY